MAKKNVSKLKGRNSIKNKEFGKKTLNRKTGMTSKSRK